MCLHLASIFLGSNTFWQYQQWSLCDLDPAEALCFINTVLCFINTVLGFLMYTNKNECNKVSKDALLLYCPWCNQTTGILNSCLIHCYFHFCKMLLEEFRVKWIFFHKNAEIDIPSYECSCFVYKLLLILATVVSIQP